MKHFIKALALLLSAALCVALLVACNTDKNATVNQNEELDQTGEQGKNETNEISEREIGVHVDMEYIAPGDYATQLNLAVPGGTPVDLCVIVNPMPAISYSNLTTQGQLTDISAYFAEGGVAREMYEMMEAYMGAYSYNGGIYGFPTYRVYGMTVYAEARGDLLDELGLADKFENMTTWSEYEEIIAALQEANPDYYGICGKQAVGYNAGVLWHGDAFADAILYDTLGDGVAVLYSDAEGKVGSMYEQPDYIAWMERVAKWAEEGMLYPDNAITIEGPNELIKQEVALSAIQQSEVGAQVTWSAEIGKPVLAKPLTNMILDTSCILKFSMGVPVTSQNPEAAMKFANLMCTNADVMNLLNWGIEGEDYVVKESGEAAFPEGVAAGESGVYHSADFIAGNYFICYPWDGNGGNFREEAAAYQKEFQVSPFLGFNVDTANMTDLIAALSSVQNEYDAPIRCGGYTESYYQEFLEKMNAAGMQEYVQAAQEQLTVYLEQ